MAKSAMKLVPLEVKVHSELDCVFVLDRPAVVIDICHLPISLDPSAFAS
jgi:hypothetical protein